MFVPLRLLVVGLTREDHIGGLWNDKTQAEQVKPGTTEEALLKVMDRDFRVSC